MYWGMGQRILQAARFVEQHPQLFGTFITNFSCGPDSFIIGYFRDIMGRKPSLTLNWTIIPPMRVWKPGSKRFLTSFPRIGNCCREKRFPKKTNVHSRPDNPRKRHSKGDHLPGEALPMTDPRVKLLVPSMGKLASESLAAVFRGSVSTQSLILRRTKRC